MARLIVKQRGQETRSFALITGMLTIGRATTNDVVISNRYTSGRHCEITCDGSRYTIYDLNSRNGLFINGAKVNDQVLEDGDRILAGGAMLIFIADENAVRVDSLLSHMQNGNAGEREIAAILLGQLGTGAAAGPLMETLRRDAEEKVKAAAAEALGLLGNSGAVKALLAFFDTQDAALRNSVVRAIIRIADEKAIPDIASFLKHSDKRVRVLAAYVLGQIRHPLATKQVEHALHDESFEVREAAVKALGDLGDPQSVDILLEIADEPQQYPYVWIVDALGKVANPRAFPTLLRALEHQSAEVREAAGEFIGSSGNERGGAGTYTPAGRFRRKGSSFCGEIFGETPENHRNGAQAVVSPWSFSSDCRNLSRWRFRRAIYSGRPLNKAAWEKWWSSQAAQE